MKKTLLCSLLLLGSTVFAQKSDNVGIGTTKPDASALLDLSSTSKGLLLPRMTQDQRNAIKNPAAGLIVFQTDQAIGTYTYDGTTWLPNARVGSAESALSTQSWSTQGNSIDGTDFIGSTNDISLKFKVNNIWAGYITSGTLGNVGLGPYSLYAQPTGGDNMGIGFVAGRNIITGEHNAAIGGYALYNNVSGGFNVAIGAGALYGVIGSNNIGIGDNTLFSAGNVSGSIAIGHEAGKNETISNKLYIANSSTATPLIGGDFLNNYLKFHTGTSAPTATAGYVAIGDFSAAGSTATPGSGGINTFPAFVAASKYRLIVQDGILTEKLKVALRNGTEWADYVFEPNYGLMTLEAVEKYTKTNKHLPNVPSANDIAKDGIDVGATSKMFMEKIEELTLYIIDLNKRIKELETKHK